MGIRDLTIGYDSSQPNGKPDLPTSLSSQMITFKLENVCLMTLRTSGTEPKIKYYTEFQSGSVVEAKQQLAVYVKDMIETCLEPELNGLK